ncbi:MAG: DNA double-strand break repair nuclease NurA [Candidatus Bathyarchaeota archaeon]|nr:DNA double-strand break repair nuclease NurA [Candidatus Bathyarchaeota archaeon]
MSNVGSGVDEFEVYFRDSAYEAFAVRPECFVPIVERLSGRRLVFVDGGNGEVYGGANFNVQLCRTCYVIFDGCKYPSKRHGVFEFISSSLVSQADCSEAKLFTSVLGDAGLVAPQSGLSLSFDKAVGDELAREVAVAARKFAEWNTGLVAVNEEMREGDMLVFDSTLQAAYPGEAAYTRRLVEEANRKGIVVAGLSKTTCLMTRHGRPIVDVAAEAAAQTSYGRWIVPVGRVRQSVHNAYIFLVKLHPDSEYIFRFEVECNGYERLGDGMEELLWLLALSVDHPYSGLTGYPYGLMKADSEVRVSENDLKYPRLDFVEAIYKMHAVRLLRGIKAVDAHSYLNRFR